MKKVVRTAAMIALMFVTATSLANDGKLSLITKKNNKSLVFEMDSKSGSTDIKLVDIYNNVIYSGSVEKLTFAKKFDLSNLEEGLYYFTTEDSLKSTTYTLKVDSSDVKILEEVEYMKPVFKKSKGMVYLNFLNLDKGDVKIEILDDENRMVFSENKENEMVIEEAFNFKKAYTGGYTVVVTANEHTFYERILVD